MFWCRHGCSFHSIYSGWSIATLIVPDWPSSDILGPNKKWRSLSLSDHLMCLWWPEIDPEWRAVRNKSCDKLKWRNKETEIWADEMRTNARAHGTPQMWFNNFINEKFQEECKKKILVMMVCHHPNSNIIGLYCCFRL